jgi:ParB family chromosome partitioning protein
MKILGKGTDRAHDAIGRRSSLDHQLDDRLKGWVGNRVTIDSPPVFLRAGDSTDRSEPAWRDHDDVPSFTPDEQAEEADQSLIFRQTDPNLRYLSVDDIVPDDETQPRKWFEDTSLAELAESIRIHGLLQPLVVTPPGADGKHRIIAGGRRWRAAQAAGLKSIPVLERESDPGASLATALVENLQREDLAPLEEAAAFDRLMQEHGLTQQEVAHIVGRSRAAVANSLRLLTLNGAVEDKLREGAITEGHARALLGVQDEGARDQALQRVLDENLSVRNTERIASESRDASGAEGANGGRTMLKDIEIRLSDSLEVPVRVSGSGARVRLSISFGSEADLQVFADRISPQAVPLSDRTAA